MTERKNFNPFNLPPEEYRGLVITCCQNYRQEIRARIEEIFPYELINSLAIISVGSDGKEERHPQSKTELVILCEEKEMFDQISSLTSKINDQNLHCDEIRVINEETLSFYKNNPQTIYPDRILNSILIWGNPEIYQKARKKVLQEMAENDSRGKKIREEIKTQISTYKKTTKIGKYRNQQVFDDNFQYYFEDNDPKKLRFGLKMGPIRAVQRKLDFFTIQGFQKGKILNPEELPTNTIERIDLLTKIGVLDENFSQKLKEAYLWFLREYHRIQEVFKNSDRTQVIHLAFIQNEFEKYREIVLQFIQ